MRQRGFTLVESVIAAAIFAVILLAAIVVSRLAVTTTEGALESQESASTAARVLEACRRELAAAALSTLTAVPAGAGMLPEPMQDGTIYDNLTFRRAVSYMNGQPVHDPAPGVPPLALSFQPYSAAPGALGDLLFFDGTAQRTLCRDVRTVEIRKTGQRLDIRLSVGGQGGDDADILGSVVLRVF